MKAVGSAPTAGMPCAEEAAAQAFVRRREPEWGMADEATLQARLSEDAAFAEAYRRAEAAWAAIGAHAVSPEILRMREQALARARKAQARRWWPRRGQGAAGLAVAALLVLATGLAFQLSPYGYHPDDYRTAIGEQRVVALEDQSTIALDAATSLRVRYSDDARTIELLDGQAQFSVSHDPARPFKVRVGHNTLVALGTVFNVEYIDRKMRVTMLEGRVAVLTDGKPGATLAAKQRAPAKPAGTTPPLELHVGDELRLEGDGPASIAKVDPDSAMAWRRGKLVFHAIPLGEAVSRLNRHSHVHLDIEDPTLAALPVSGVFEAGDAHAFAQALESYLPLAADYSDPSAVRLHRR